MDVELTTTTPTSVPQDVLRANHPPRPKPPPPTFIQTLLHKMIRVTITDGRIFLGTFAGTDQPLNLVLVNAEEYRLPGENGGASMDGRYVGLIMIPWKRVVKVEAEMRKERNARRKREMKADDDNPIPAGYF